MFQTESPQTSTDHRRKTYTGHLPEHTTDYVVGADAIIGWVSALLLGFSVFLPAIGDRSLVQAFLDYGVMGSSMRWIFLTPIIAGVAVALLAGLPYAIHRRKAFACLWVMFSAAGACAINEAGFGLDPMAEGFRAGGGLAVAPRPSHHDHRGYRDTCRGHRRTGAAQEGARVVTGSGLRGPPGGPAYRHRRLWRLLPTPEVSLSEGEYARLSQGGTGGVGRQINIDIVNEGRRELHLVCTHAPSGARNVYRYVIERRIGENSWAEVTGHVPALGDTPGAGLTIAPAEHGKLAVDLPEGKYRVLLHSFAASDTRQFPFTVTVPQSAASMLGEASPDSPDLPPQDRYRSEKGGDTVAQPSLEVELDGIMTGSAMGPVFSIMFHRSERPSGRLLAAIGQTLDGAWVVSEFNENLNTVTISNGEEILILSQGERVALRE